MAWRARSGRCRVSRVGCRVWHYVVRMALKIYTRTGDSGDTGLFGGGRVGKDHPRVEAYGAVDELNAAIGMARSVEAMPRVDEVAVHPLPSIRATLPDLDPELEQIVMLALERDPARRPTAAAMGRALDDWCEAQNEIGSPDRLQAHLARLFPSTFRPQSRTSGETTTFKNLRRSIKRPSKGIMGWLFGA